MDWQKRIERAERQYMFIKADRDKARKWRTCVVGEVWPEEAEIINLGKPYPGALLQLVELGLRFYDVVGFSDIASAKQVYKEIKEWKPSG